MRREAKHTQRRKGEGRAGVANVCAKEKKERQTKIKSQVGIERVGKGKGHGVGVGKGGGREGGREGTCGQGGNRQARGDGDRERSLSALPCPVLHTTLSVPVLSVPEFFFLSAFFFFMLFLLLP